LKNEVEIIEQSIAHLHSTGVYHILVCDMPSTDGTAEIRARLG
jgi:glycosyltransferase involved in cell wall biosynthesis